jgi:dihydrofolate reductase
LFSICCLKNLLIKEIEGETITNYAYVATSLDGFIATSDEGLDWLNEIPNPEQSDHSFAEFMNRIDTIVMGRKTFQTVLAFNSWPYKKPVFVLSKTLKTVPKNFADKAEVKNGDIRDIVRQLNDRGYRKLYIDGGKTIQSFLEEDLIDEITITRVPVLLGDGIPLFGKLSKRLRFIHKETEILNQQMVKSRYERIRG